MAIPAANQVHPLVMPMSRVQFTWPDTASKDPRAGMLTPTALQMLQQLVEFVSGTSRIVPVSITGTNALTLTLNPSGPLLTMHAGSTAHYHDYDVFSGVAANNSTGAVTASVVTANRPTGDPATLPSMKVYITNGATQAGAGALTAGRHYTFTFVDALDTGTGGFVLR